MAIDRLNAMRIFCRVVEAQSFTRAAQSLSLPKANVSTAVSNLEAELGVRLLQRTTRNLSITPDGAAYYERVVRILGEIEETESALRSATASPKGRLRVDLPALIARWVVVPALPDFVARYPDLELQVGATDRTVDLIEEGVDCVIRGGEQPDSTLIARRIGDLRLIRCASPDYLDRHGRPRTIEDLRDHRVIHYFYARSGKIREFHHLDEHGARIEIPLPHRFSTNDADTYTAAGLAGLGIMQGAEIVVERLIAEGALEPVLPELRIEPVPLYVMYMHNRHLSAKVRVFVDWVANLFEEKGLTARA
jgi:LysR family transcriptional regulator for bpeEF and oprC